MNFTMTIRETIKANSYCARARAPANSWRWKIPNQSDFDFAIHTSMRVQY